MDSIENITRDNARALAAVKATRETELAQRLMKAIAESGERMLPWFGFSHLKDTVQDVSMIFARAALDVVARVPAGPERTVALRKLLEGKDAAVRAAL